MLLMQNATGQVLSTAPVWSIGVHVNPTITTPLMDSRSTYDAAIKPVPNINYNIGFNLHYTLSEMTIETGINYVLKSFTIRQRLYSFNNVPGYSHSRNTQYFLSLGSASIEVALLLSYCLHHHDKRMVYDLHAVAGASAERNQPTQYLTSTIGSHGSIVQQDYTLPTEQAKEIWVNAIVGFKIHTILRRIGLLDYGLIWHVPLQKSEAYTLTSVVKDFSTGDNITYNGTYYPRLGYLDIKLCYYLLNFYKDCHRLKYRTKRNDDY
jgi:hypothetical protein